MKNAAVRLALFCAFFALFLPKKAFAQPKWMHLTASQGVRDFAVIGNSTVWACGAMGLSRIDLATGEAENFNENNSDLPSTQIETFAVGPDGTVWFSIWNNGLWAMRPSGAVEKVEATSPSGDVAQRAYEIFPLGTDEVIFQGLVDWDNYDSGIWHLKNGALLPIPEPFSTPGIAFSDFFVDQQKRIWVGGVHKIARFDGSDWQVFNTPNVRPISIAEAPNGAIWASCIENSSPFGVQLFRIENGSIEKIDGPTDALYDAPIIGFDAADQPVLHETQKDKIWHRDVTTGVWSATAVAPPAGFLSPFYWFQNAKLAADGTIWLVGIGDNSTLFSIENGQNQLKKWENLGNSTVPANRLSQIQIALGNQKFLSDSRSLHRFDGQNWLEIALPFSTDSSSFSLVGASPKDDALWLLQSEQRSNWPFFRQTLVRFDGQNFQLFPLEKPSGEPFQLTQSRLGLGHDGTVWLPTNDGKLWKMDENGQFLEETDFPGSPSSMQIHDIFVDQKGRVWAVNDHLFWLENGVWNDEKLTGLHPEFPNFNDNRSLGSLFVTSADEVFFMSFADGKTAFSGLFRWQNGSLGHVYAPPSFDQNAPVYSSGGWYSILEDASKNIWFNLGQIGLFKIDATTTNWTWLNHENSGFPSVGANSMTIDSFQNIWLTTDCGLVIFNENGIQKLNFSPDAPAFLFEKIVAAPNPATEFVEIWLPTDWPEGVVELQIFDEKGKLVATQKTSVANGSATFSIGHFAPGLFFVQAKTGEKWTGGKFLKF